MGVSAYYLSHTVMYRNVGVNAEPLKYKRPANVYCSIYRPLCYWVFGLSGLVVGMDLGRLNGFAWWCLMVLEQKYCVGEWFLWIL